MTTLKDALVECNDRIIYCANLYGEKWKQEEEFLKLCRKALKHTINYWLSEEDIKLIKGVFKSHFTSEIPDIVEKHPEYKELFDKLDLLKEG